MTASGPILVHATALVVGEAGVLIEGPSGSGKSALALAMLAAQPRLVRLVGDDRVALSVAGERLLARPHPRIAGVIERRGVGLERVEYEPACVIRLVLRREPHPERLPAERPSVKRLGISLPLCRCPTAFGPAEAAAQCFAAIQGLSASGSFELLQGACQFGHDTDDSRRWRAGGFGAAPT